ncbi:MAG: hypothetical protein GVY13_14790 [Alphaproteobacteria bacterium]|jgi:hypothetical protein|nr:hypothetical protein [Alphaproteobacteria bacterium]
MFGLEIGFLGLILLILVLWAGFHIIQSNISPFAKALWVVVLIFLPFLGWLAWLLFGPRANR